jgi:hypothetical protein
MVWLEDDIELSLGGHYLGNKKRFQITVIILRNEDSLIGL